MPREESSSSGEGSAGGGGGVGGFGATGRDRPGFPVAGTLGIPALPEVFEGGVVPPELPLGFSLEVIARFLICGLVGLAQFGEHVFIFGKRTEHPVDETG